MDTAVRELSDLRERIVRSIVATLAPMLAPHAAESLYVVAVTTDSDVMTIRLTAHTEEALADLLAEADAETDAETAEYYRWWPDEWQMADDDAEPENGVAPLTTCSDELAAAMVEAPDHAEWRTRARALLDEALGDERVTARLAAINPGWRPVLFVTDTDGDMRPTVQSIDRLNTTHPNPQAVAAARTYFADQY